MECEVIDLHCGYFGKNKIKKAFDVIIRCIRLKHQILKKKPKACISFGNGCDLVNLLCKTKFTKVITSIRGYSIAEDITNSSFQRKLYLRSDKIICVSKVIEEKIIKDIPELKSKTSVLYNGYDCEEIISLSNQKINFPIGNKHPIISTAGTLKPEKGYWYLLKSISLLMKKYPDIQLWMIGADENGYVEKIKGLIALLHLENNVVFWGWQSNPYQFIKASDLYVLPSVREGFPNALVEAMICGKPVIANDCLSGPREILTEDGSASFENGISLTDYGVLLQRFSDIQDYSETITNDSVCLADAIEKMLKSDTLIQHYSVKSYERAETFSYKECRLKFIEIVESV